MMMSFLAQLAGSTDGLHIYRIIIDGGERFTFVTIDVEGGRIFSSTAEGEPAGDMRMSLVDGSSLPSTTESDVRDDSHRSISREEFALVSSSIRRALREKGAPPANVTKYYG
ncbi:hypothetical protein [Streptomyces sedi]|uniref:Uncharacterized protein n=1 Tax=Streptomyces sedi TaxID=555059 RepID=A0A5C4V9I8_9ACTN|nr:hypothetical protein [Streptomyces sedi]TNM32156.1 hypothetical protein FH715_07070 [Streptomyces sedi]